MPEIPDPKTAEVILKALIKILKVEIDMSELKDKIKEMESFMSKIQKVQSKALSQMMAKEMGKGREKEDLKYIG